MVDFEAPVDPMDAISRDIADLRGELLATNIFASLAFSQLIMAARDRSMIFDALAARVRHSIESAQFEGGDPVAVERARSMARRRAENLLSQLERAAKSS